eukprot:scaffold13452_cov29-Cyclotella_meneghiniana.AAC.1
MREGPPDDGGRTGQDGRDGMREGPPQERSSQPGEVSKATDDKSEAGVKDSTLNNDRLALTHSEKTESKVHGDEATDGAGGGTTMDVESSSGQQTKATNSQQEPTTTESKTSSLNYGQTNKAVAAAPPLIMDVSGVDSSKRPREEITVDDNTPKAGAFRHQGGSFFHEQPPLNYNHRVPPPQQAMTHHAPPPPMHYGPSTKRTRLNSGDEYYPTVNNHPNKYEKSSFHPITNSLRPIRSPTHRRSFSLESECRQDKPVRHQDESMPRYRPASYSPNSLTSRRSFDFYRVTNDDADRSLCRSHSWTNELEGRSRSMSWEVPPALSAICSFGQLNNDSLKSPVRHLSPPRRSNGEDNGNNIDDSDMLPPLPGMMESKNSFPLAPRPVNKMMDRRDADRTLEPREYYSRSSSQGPNNHHLHMPPRDRGADSGRVYYTTNSPPRGARESSRYHYDERYYEDTRYHKPEMRRYEERRPHENMDMMMVVDRREPYNDSRRYRRYEDERYHRSPPPPPPRDAYFGYPNDTPGGLSSRSFDSRSLGDMEEPRNDLLYRPSFSWERGCLDMPSDYDQPATQNKILVQLNDQQKLMKALTMRNEIRTIGNPNSSIGLILLLAMPNDRHCLSETLCIIRNNVEVFTATQADIDAPAPGRKRPIQVGQVGLRCVYCRMCTSDRVKRAMCFPTSTKRIYRAMIDMKLDHFPHCPYIPQGLKARLEELSASSTRSTGMTVQYFVKSAKEMGMVDMNEGMYIDLRRVGKELDAPFNNIVAPPPTASAPPSQKSNPAKEPSNKVQFKPKPTPVELDPNIKRFHGKVILSLPDDGSFLSPLRCFLRRNVCAFTATQTDIAVRTPTTFSVRIGQVGVGCVHCLSVPPKQRSNRAVCFPFTVARIYQSVADIQRFHLGECKMMPPEVRAEFLQLQSESAKGSRGLATRTYWIDSARKIGLADGPGGMYFSRDPSLPPPPQDEESSDLLAQVATNANTNFKPLVTPEDKPTIAEFLYVVMEQLQPCLFTDADRNKRRSKNIGSVGVECKHCAGKIDGRKFFWSSVSAAESNFVSVHSHMMTCKYISDDLKTELGRLKSLRREQTSRLRTGSQKAFFTRVWNRLHEEPDEPDESDKEDSKTTAPVPPLSMPDAAVSSSKPEDFLPALPPSKSLENDIPFDNMVELPTGGSQDEIRVLLECKSTLSNMSGLDDVTKIEASQCSDEETHKPDSEIKMDGS